MTTSKSNPFVLPGLGQEGDLAGNPFLASMEMMRNAWAGLTGPGGLAQSLPMAPPMNLEDLERRINELRSVESWLRMNLSMLSSAIQGMEVQRSTIATLRSFVAAGANADGPSPLEVVLGLKPGKDAAPPFAAPKSEPEPQPPETPTGSEGASAADPMAQAAQSASQAWWNLLQQQFNQIATATAASMPATPQAGAPAAGADAPSAASDAAPRKRAPRKTAAKRATNTRKS
ncbi:PhaM family polyhydroxyalkanoate granule multifunctional regulatory protein [Bordetella sp. 02P26C-1]|uniref:PhaM family polyhydroxyalkanoate granule multifunctional regulatory protein n=1 Tax=Bordetella sp. 02P26C-1 TaxID=2683195 RepID=UPI0013552D13|nr:PhaM family polyhydroxyalkanoate granule multifunctional regulatory protein [Bordetella sp. 02P26C-1]MVW78461.1 transcriptional regulator [Bordetella sp. 02P26C-1]